MSMDRNARRVIVAALLVSSLFWGSVVPWVAPVMARAGVALVAKMSAGNSSDGLNQQASFTTAISASSQNIGASPTLLVVVLAIQGAGGAPTSPTATAGGTAMTVGPVATSGKDVAAVLYLVNPTGGSQTIAAGWSTQNGDAYMSWASFSGTDTTTGVQASDNRTATNTTSITVPSSTDGATVATFAVDGSAPTVNFTKIFSIANLNPGGGASYALGGTNNAHTFTGAGGTVQALAGVHIIAAAGGGPSPFVPGLINAPIIY